MTHDIQVRHYRRPADTPFTADQRAEVTILLGGLTWKHERLIQAVLQNSGHSCECLPLPDREAHEIGKEYCGNNLCNPVYFTAGSLIKYLRGLEKKGLSRPEIVRRYVFFTAGSGGPCRYGMYEAEFRAALAAAGFQGFRVMLFVQEQGVKASTGQPGLEFSADFNMGAFHAFILGDLLNDLHRKLRAYETSPGQADAVVSQVVSHLANYFRNARHFDLAESAPPWIRGPLRRHRTAAAFRWTNTTLKICEHLCGNSLKSELRHCRKILSTMTVNRLQVKPMVKVIGEFWAQLTEGDGNFRMFEFLEQEGAEVAIEPISTWVMYLLHQAMQRLAIARRLTAYEQPWTHPLRAVAARLRNAGKRALFSMAESIYRDRYDSLAKELGGFSAPLISQSKLATIADPHYCSMLRGGEGHLEVAKNLYYTRNRKSHMVLALKPFGCLPSMQSDAVQASLMEKTPEMLFLSVETSGDGEIHAYSRVQMALADAKNKARQEFAKVLAASRYSLDDICKFAQVHSWLRSPLYRVPRQPGVTSTAANFVLHVSKLMSCATDTRSFRKVPNEYSSRRPALAVMPSRQETNNV
jgi:predicted nucleotide-binding protein (sugar kinase/HSP70/actin superfamily)